MEMKKLASDPFAAKDSSNTPYTIYVCAIHAVYADLEPIGIIPPCGQDWLETSDGHRVDYIKKGHYRITDLKLDLTSDDPKAWQPHQ